MQVDIQSVFVETPSRWGPVKKQHGLSRVLVDGNLAGYVPVEGDKNAGVFHPLQNFPREHESAVIKASGGKLTRSIRDKKAKNEPVVEQASKPKA